MIARWTAQNVLGEGVCYNWIRGGISTAAPPPNSPVHLRFLAVLVHLCTTVGCGVLATTTELAPPPSVLPAASRLELIETVQRIATVESMRASVDITLTVRAADLTEEVRSRDVRGVLITRRPGWIRTNAEAPGGITTVYDMASDGEQFRVFIPLRNRVYEGRNEMTEISEERIENLRPQHILDAIMINRIENPDEVILDREMYGSAGYQILIETEPGEDGIRRITRKYWFSRADLKLARLIIFNDRTEVVTDAWYRDWGEDKGLPYPQFLEIERPLDGYILEFAILKPGLNEDIPDASFELTLPDGVEVETLGNQSPGNS